jgi:hypothetical protein
VGHERCRRQEGVRDVGSAGEAAVQEINGVGDKQCERQGRRRKCRGAHSTGGGGKGREGKKKVRTHWGGAGSVQCRLSRG